MYWRRASFSGVYTDIVYVSTADEWVHLLFLHLYEISCTIRVFQTRLHFVYVKDRVVEVQCNSLAPLLTLLSCLPTTDPPLPSYHLKPLKLKTLP